MYRSRRHHLHFKSFSGLTVGLKGGRVVHVSVCLLLLSLVSRPRTNHLSTFLCFVFVCECVWQTSHITKSTTKSTSSITFGRGGRGALCARGRTGSNTTRISRNTEAESRGTTTSPRVPRPRTRGHGRPLRIHWLPALKANKKLPTLKASKCRK